MSDEREELILRYLNGETTEEESRKLLDWVKEKPTHADLFMELSALHSNLRMQLLGSTAIAGKPELAEPEKVITLRWQTVALAIAASWLILLAFNSAERAVAPADINRGTPETLASTPAGAREERRVATLIQAEDLRLTGMEARIGGEIYSGKLIVEAGLAALEMDGGVILSVKGPAELIIESVDEVSLTSGLLTARVPKGAEGFRVRTHRVDVVDLGTFFGVSASEDGGVKVAVFQGEVVLDARDGSDQKPLLAGDALRIHADGAREPASPDAGAFSVAWRQAVGIASQSPSVEVLPNALLKSSPQMSDDRLFLHCEGAPAELLGDLEVDVTSAGSYRRESDLSVDSLDRGTRVRSYLLQFRPELGKTSGDKKPEFRQVRGEVTFARPIAGIILSDERLKQSERNLSRSVSRKLYGRQLGVEFVDRPFGDRVELTEDRRTLRVDLRATAGFSDYLRVLVEAGDPATDHLAALRP